MNKETKNLTDSLHHFRLSGNVKEGDLYVREDNTFICVKCGKSLKTIKGPCEGAK